MQSVNTEKDISRNFSTSMWSQQVTMMMNVTSYMLWRSFGASSTSLPFFPIKKSKRNLSQMFDKTCLFRSNTRLSKTSGWRKNVKIEDHFSDLWYFWSTVCFEILVEYLFWVVWSNVGFKMFGQMFFETFGQMCLL